MREVWTHSASARISNPWVDDSATCVDEYGHYDGEGSSAQAGRDMAYACCPHQHGSGDGLKRNGDDVPQTEVVEAFRQPRSKGTEYCRPEGQAVHEGDGSPRGIVEQVCPERWPWATAGY